MSDVSGVASQQAPRLSQEALTALRGDFPGRRIWQATSSDGKPGALYAATSATFTDWDLRGPGIAQTVVADTEADLRDALALQPDVQRDLDG